MAHYKHKALQNGDEHKAFCDLLVREQVKSYLEIGSFMGGSLWKVATALPKGSLIVAVDLPAMKPEPSQPLLEACANDLRNLGYDVKLLIGDSTRHDIVAAAARLAPFDACFIDANHTLPYCTADWQNYGAMARIVAFHDIAWKPEHRVGKLPIQVPTLWASIKDAYRHEEIRKDVEQNENGIGVIWRS